MVPGDAHALRGSGAGDEGVEREEYPGDRAERIETPLVISCGERGDEVRDDPVIG